MALQARAHCQVKSKTLNNTKQQRRKNYTPRPHKTV